MKFAQLIDLSRHAAKLLQICTPGSVFCKYWTTNESVDCWTFAPYHFGHVVHVTPRPITERDNHPWRGLRRNIKASLGVIEIYQLITHSTSTPRNRPGARWNRFVLKNLKVECLRESVRELSTEHWALSTKHWALSTEHWVLSTEHWALSISILISWACIVLFMQTAATWTWNKTTFFICGDRACQFMPSNPSSSGCLLSNQKGCVRVGAKIFLTWESIQVLSGAFRDRGKAGGVASQPPTGGN